MISIDTIYQRVLAITNKEQRGYVTPLEFNLIANQAQVLIFEQYFYDLDQAKRITSSDDSSFSDLTELIKNKLADFTSISTVTSGHTFPANYRTGRVFANNYEAKLVELNDIKNILDSTFHRAGLNKNPLYVESLISGQDIQVFNSNGQMSSNITVEVITVPAKVEWGYDVIAEKALYNASRSTNFTLHDSEESELVYKILTLAGLAIKREDVMKAGQGLDIVKTQQEKQ